MAQRRRPTLKLRSLSCVRLNEETHLWDVLVEPARKIRIGNKLFFDEVGTMVAEVYDNTTSRGRSLRFLYDCPHDQFKHDLFALGEAPLPVYILNGRPADPDMEGMHVRSHATKEDMENFQCIFAKNEGAVTAPATGLHFSRGDETYGDQRHQYSIHHTALRLKQFLAYRGGGSYQA